jgi:hypothetical protein
MTLKLNIQWTMQLYKCLVVLALFASVAPAQDPGSKESDVLEIGARRELFVDRFLIERLDNETLKLHEPAKVPRPRSPLVGGYAAVIKDGDLFRSGTPVTVDRETDNRSLCCGGWSTCDILLSELSAYMQALVEFENTRGEVLHGTSRQHQVS